MVRYQLLKYHFCWKFTNLSPKYCPRKYLCTVLYISLISEAETDRQIEKKKKKETQTVDRQTDTHTCVHAQTLAHMHIHTHKDNCTPWYPPREGEVLALPASSARGRRSGNRSGCPARPGHACACEKQLPAALWAAACDHPCPQCHPLPATATIGCPCCHPSRLHMRLPSEGRDSNTGEWQVDTSIRTTSSCFMPGLFFKYCKYIFLDFFPFSLINATSISH